MKRVKFRPFFNLDVSTFTNYHPHVEVSGHITCDIINKNISNILYKIQILYECQEFVYENRYNATLVALLLIFGLSFFIRRLSLTCNRYRSFSCPIISKLSRLTMGPAGLHCSFFTCWSGAKT